MRLDSIKEFFGICCNVAPWLLGQRTSTQQQQKHSGRQRLARLLTAILCLLSSVLVADASRVMHAASPLRGINRPKLPRPVSNNTARPSATQSPELQHFLTRYYRGQMPREQLAAAKAAVAATAAAAAATATADGVITVSSSNYSWADPSWGQYRELIVVPLEGTPGLPIWGWDGVISQEAVDQAALVLGNMLRQLQDDIAQRLLSFPGVKFALFKRPEQQATHIPEHSVFPELSGAAGLGGTQYVPVSSCDAENVLETDWDPYFDESILVHEFAHAIHMIGMSDCERAAVLAAYNSARASGAYSNDAYMIRDEAEYWASAAEGWFGASRRSDVNEGLVSRARLWAHDPTLFRLLRYVFKSNVVHWKYSNVCPRCRDKWPPESSVTMSPLPAAPMLSLPASGLASCTAPLINAKSSTQTSSRPIPLLPGDCHDTFNASTCGTLIQQKDICQTRRGYAMHNCQDTCFGPSLCTDLSHSCQQDALVGLCDSDPDVMSVQCMKSCGLCYQTSFARRVFVATGKGRYVVKICRDNKTNCYVGANVYGNCTQEAFRADCPFSCGVC